MGAIRKTSIAVVAITSLFAALASSAAAAGPPNILLIVTDDQRAEETLRVMPETRRLFAGDGVRFTDAVATTPNCCPSRASIMTGQYMHNHGVLHNQNNQAELEQLDTESLFASRLQTAGYHTAYVGKFLNGWPLDTPPPDYDDFAMTPGGIYGTAWNINGERSTVSKYSTDFMKSQTRKMIARTEASDKKPWFLVMSLSAPHGTLGPDGVSLEPAPRHADAGVGHLKPTPERSETSAAALMDKPPFWRALVAGYAPGPGAPSAAEARTGQLRMLMAVDEAVDRVFDKLRATGEDRKTLAIFMSDNGLFWGEHGAPPVKDMPYGPAVKIPLLMRWPNVLDKSVDGRLAANIDIAPTVLDAAGIESLGGMDGRSLLEPWERESILLEYAASGQFPTWASIFRPGVEQFSEYYRQTGAVLFREYTDLDADPFQLENPIVDLNPLNDPDVPALRADLLEALACEGASCP
jgi:arylsulfatase A-like enzyme